MKAVRLLLILTATLLLAGMEARLGEAPAVEASFPGTNGKIVFRTVTGQIATINSDGTELTPIATGLAPQWSPDGKRIVFSNVADVFVMNADGTGIVNLTANHTPLSSNPSWSPAGDEIVFLSHDDGGNDALYIVSTDGTGLRRLTPEIRVRGRGSWSPDGNLIIFSVHRPDAFSASISPAGFENYDLYTIHPDGSGLTQVTNTPGSAELDADWSPDGSRFVFARHPDEGALSQTVEIALAGGGVVGVVATGTVGSPDWSPDGTKIAFRNNNDINVMNADGSGSHFLTAGLTPDWQPVTGLVDSVEFTQGIQELQPVSGLESSFGPGRRANAFPGANGKIAFWDVDGISTISPNGTGRALLADVSQSAPRWSPDGGKIVFAALTQGGNGTDVFVMNQNGSGRVNLTNRVGVDWAPTWAPDGQRIAFVRDQDGASQIWVMNANGSGAHAITNFQDPGFAYGAQPSWSPDGTKILLVGITGGNRDLYTIAPDGSGLHNLTNTPGQEAYSDWSPDAAKIVFSGWTSVNPRDDAVYTINADGSGRQRVSAGLGIAPSWSPDGSALAYADGPDFTLSTMNADGSGVNSLGIRALSTDWQPRIVHSVEFTQGIQELQGVSLLEADIAGDGAPPVPIVAGKPAAMRIYMSKVEATTVYEIEATGDVNGSRFVQLDPGCTPEQRRKEENNCRSVDFFFTPPSGDWSVTLKVRRQQDSQVLEEHEFNLTSAETIPLFVKPVTVCDNVVSPGPPATWSCGSLFDFAQNLEYMRKIFPGEVFLAGANSHIFTDTDEVPQNADWWQVVGDQVRSLWAAESGLDNVYYYGVVRPQADAGTAGGIAYTSANAAAGRTAMTRPDMDGGLPSETGPELTAHLLGDAMGLGHAPSGAGCYGDPGPTDPGWPGGGSPEIGETGFDVDQQDPVPDTHADIMSYCAPRWISPYTYNAMLDVFRAPGSPAFQAQAITQGDFWLISGSINEDDQTAEFDPIFEFETQGETAQGSGLYSVEVRDGSSAVLYERFFTVDKTLKEDVGSSGTVDPAVVRFAELIPVQAGAVEIAVFSGNNELEVIPLGGSAPVVNLTPGAPFRAQGAPPSPTFSWTVTDGDSSSHTFWVQLSLDGGATWRSIAPRFDGASITVDPKQFGGASNAMLRILASDGVNTGVAETGPFSMQTQAPQGAITGPGGSSFRLGDLVWLQFTAFDPEDGFLDGSAVQWSSSLDGNLGTGASLPVYDLSAGTHTISVLATDSDGFQLADSITVTVFDGPIVEGQVGLSGDVDCSGAVNAVDALKLSRQVAGLTVAQTQPCPVIGVGDPLVFGDINCDGNITAVDTLFVLRFVAGMPVNLPQGCRQVGT